jgi:hypothetical protein
MVLAAGCLVGFAALPFTSTTLMGIHHTSVVPRHFTTSGIDTAYTRSNILVITARRIICQAATPFAGPTISRALTTIFCKTTFPISANGRGLAGVHAKVSIVVNFWVQGKTEGQFGNHINIHHIYGPITISICKVTFRMNAAWKITLSGKLPQGHQNRALNVHYCRHGILVHVTWRVEASSTGRSLTTYP